MSLKVDYFTSLSRAVARLDRDSYEARGAVYDRAKRDLERRLSSARPKPSEDEIERERQAFRDAIQRIEFGGEAPSPIEPEPEPEAEPEPRPKPKPERDARRRDEIKPRKEAPKRPPVVRRIAARMLIAVVVLGLCGAGYGYVTGELSAKALTTWMLDQVAGLISSGSSDRDATFAPASADRGAAEKSAAQRAVLYEEDKAYPQGKPYVGKAFWRVRSEPGAKGRPETVLALEVEIPERGFVLTMSMQRGADEGAMSHLVELRIVRAKEVSIDGISRVNGILMKDAEEKIGVPLAGQAIKVAPGLFLFGLSSQEGDAQRNLQLLKERPWVDIPFFFSNGATMIVAVEKGASGERAINAALDKWGK
jgi:hypothetical protein